MDGWVNSREAGDLRRHRAHYDITAMHLWQRIFDQRISSNNTEAPTWCQNDLLITSPNPTITYNILGH